MRKLLQNVSKIAILGAGQMGSGIAQVIAQRAHIPVYIYDSSPSALKSSMAAIERMIRKDVEKGKLSSDGLSQSLSRLQPIDSLAMISDSDVVIEAIKEDFLSKKALFLSIKDIVSPSAIIASNTSSISITKLAATTNHPDKFIGMHFMNPGSKIIKNRQIHTMAVMPLVEIIQGLTTSKETLQTTVNLAKAMGKVATFSKDTPGFIANRLLMPYINEAIFALNEEVSSREDIDTTMKEGCNMPMGPLSLADLIGLDTCLAILQVLHSQMGDSKYRPCPLLQQHVDAGFLGRKSGKGFFEYK